MSLLENTILNIERYSTCKHYHITNLDALLEDIDLSPYEVGSIVHICCKDAISQVWR